MTDSGFRDAFLIDAIDHRWDLSPDQRIIEKRDDEAVCQVCDDLLALADGIEA